MYADISSDGMSLPLRSFRWGRTVLSHSFLQRFVHHANRSHRSHQTNQQLSDCCEDFTEINDAFKITDSSKN